MPASGPPLRALPRDRDEPAALEVDPHVPAVLRVRLALETWNEPARLVLQLAEEGAELRVGTGQLVDAVRARKDSQGQRERCQPHQQPSPIDPQNLALVPGDRP